MRRLGQLAVLLAVASPGVVLAGSGIAQAAPGTSHSVKPAVLQSAWFWENAVEQGQPPVAPGQLPATEPSGVPKGDLAVANTNSDGSSSKMTVLAFSLGAAAKPDTTISAFTFSVTLDTSPSAADVAATSAPVVACLPTRLWSPAEGGDYTNEPSVDCADKVKPTIKGNTFTFTIPAIAQDWVDDQNVGVALVNDPANTSTPFQAVFTGPKTVQAAMTFLPPLAVPAATGGSGSTTGSGSGATAGSGSGAGSASGGTSTPTGAGSVPSGPVNLPPSGPTTATLPGSTTTPDVAPPTTPSTPVTQQAAGAIRRAPSAPNGAFWVAAAALALLIVGAGLVLADNRVPVPNAVTTKLGLVLRQRQRERDREQSHDLATSTFTLGRV